jgi:hypothetical protein
LIYQPIEAVPLFIFGGAAFSFLYERVVILLDELILKISKKTH